jgi:hypothetical protein
MTESDETKNIVRATLAMEYTMLRGEISQRREIRQQLISVTLTLAAAFLGFGISEVGIALVYPPLAMLLALSWYQNDHQSRLIAAYVRENHEGEDQKREPYWEKYMHQLRLKEGTSNWLYVVLSHGGIFLITQGMAIAIGLSNFTETTIEWLLLGFDVISVLIVVFLLWRSR